MKLSIIAEFTCGQVTWSHSFACPGVIKLVSRVTERALEEQESGRRRRASEIATLAARTDEEEAASILMGAPPTPLPLPAPAAIASALAQESSGPVDDGAAAVPIRPSDTVNPRREAQRKSELFVQAYVHNPQATIEVLQAVLDQAPAYTWPGRAPKRPRRHDDATLLKLGGVVHGGVGSGPGTAAACFGATAAAAFGAAGGFGGGADAGVAAVNAAAAAAAAAAVGGVPAAQVAPFSVAPAPAGAGFEPGTVLMSPAGFSPTAAPGGVPAALSLAQRGYVVAGGGPSSASPSPPASAALAPGAAPPAVAGNAASWFGGQSGSVDAESMSDADLLGLVTDDGGSGAVDGD